jgi:hypothetical protein
MTPPNKAYNLYHKFYNTLLPNVRERQRIAIEHSLIAVDEIIASIPTLPNNNNKLEKTTAITYWVEVKNELLKQQSNVT